jgi:hypothetical protein
VQPIQPHLIGVALLVPEAAVRGAGLMAQLFAEDVRGLAVLLLPCRFVQVEQLAAATDIVQVEAVEGVITPDTVKAAVKEEFPYLTPILFKEDKVKEWKCVLLPKASAGSSKAPTETRDISSGDVQVSLLFTKVTLKPEDFGGETDVTDKQICDYLVKSGYPEFAASRCTIEKASDKLLIAVIKSSRKG